MKKKLNEPSRKLGAKYLDDIQLEGCFPDWKALLTNGHLCGQPFEFVYLYSVYWPSNCV